MNSSIDVPDVSPISTDQPSSPTEDAGASNDQKLTWRGLLDPINLIGLAWVMFQIGILFFTDVDLLIRRSGHLGFACAMAMVFRYHIGPLLVAIISAIALSPAIYISLNLGRLYARIPEVDPVLWTDYLFGHALLALVIEASRRRIGTGLSMLAVSIIDISLWLTVHRTCGPAKAAIVSSALTGSLSGSAIANVMSAGVFTILLMKRAGYSLVFAGNEGRCIYNG